MRRTISGALIAFGLTATVLASASCGGEDGGEDHGAGAHDSAGMNGSAPPEGAIRVSLLNWAVEPEQTSARAGEVTFWAVHDMQHSHGANEGGDVHDLQVLKKTAAGGTELVGQVQGLRMGEAKALTLTLEPGEYELACTVVEVVNDEAVGHYSKGMRTAFTVTA